MRQSLIIYLLLLSTCCYSQAVTLKVLGQHAYFEKSEAYGMNITLEEDPNKCDPIKGFVSLEEQEKHLIEAIEAKGSKAKLLPIKDYGYSEYRKKSFKLVESDYELFNSILTTCKNMQASVSKTYYILPQHDFEEEDRKAIEALKDAIAKADVISNHIKHKVNKILFIDDETRGVSGLFDLSGYDDEFKLKYLDLMERLSSVSINNKESSSSSRSGKYNLWVAFELVPE